MPIETVCQTCGRQLRIADEHAGKTARCPACQTIYTVPQAASLSQPVHWPAAASASPGGIDRWHLRTPDGLTYGPVARAELDQWLQQGRITAQSQVLCEADGQWVFAAKLYPLLGATAPPASAPAPQATTNTYPYASQFADRPYTNMPY
ncbi:MAG TPA: GYF domain-containing protein, partial [Pirellulaceae bacterium]|nr:GYF domain-containing protein [Pirellulaceae bacterium]